MSLTLAAHKRFWASMGERFGKRWLEEMGDEPTKAWKELLDQYSPDDVAEALLRLKDRPEQQRSYIPTHAEFETLLVKAARAKRTDVTDYVRGFWRSAIVYDCARLLIAAAIIRAESEFEFYLADNRARLGEPLRHLLDELCDMEQRNQGQRTHGLFKHAGERCKSIVTAYIEQRSSAAA